MTFANFLRFLRLNSESTFIASSCKYMINNNDKSWVGLLWFQNPTHLRISLASFGDFISSTQLPFKEYMFDSKRCTMYICERYHQFFQSHENFRIVDIEINAWSSHFLHNETNLILYLYLEHCLKFNQLESRIWSR